MGSQLNYTYNECGPVHITIGDGGNVEGVRTCILMLFKLSCKVTLRASALTSGVLPVPADVQVLHRHCSTAGHLQQDAAADRQFKRAHVCQRASVHCWTGAAVLPNRAARHVRLQVSACMETYNWRCLCLGMSCTDDLSTCVHAGSHPLAMAFWS